MLTKLVLMEGELKYLLIIVALLYSTVAFAQSDSVKKIELSSEAAIKFQDDLKELKKDPKFVAGFLVGKEDIYNWYFIETEMPDQLLDVDGGRIRVILQHETNPNDQVRTLEIHIGCEWTDDRLGKRGRYAGRSCWARQVGGGEYFFVLGDGTPHIVLRAWKEDWARIVDHQWRQGNAVLEKNMIRIYAHPRVTARVFFYD